jgi:hypothetical protein
MAMLADIAWTPVSPQVRTDPRGQYWATASSQHRPNIGEFCSMIARDVIHECCEEAETPSFMGSSLWQGADAYSAIRRCRALRKQGRQVEAGILQIVVAAAFWPKHRRDNRALPREDCSAALPLTQSASSA